MGIFGRARSPSAPNICQRIVNKDVPVEYGRRKGRGRKSRKGNPRARHRLAVDECRADERKPRRPREPAELDQKSKMRVHKRPHRNPARKHKGGRYFPRVAETDAPRIHRREAENYEARRLNEEKLLSQLSG